MAMLFMIVPVLVVVIFAVVIGTIVTQTTRQAAEWMDNNSRRIETAAATVTAKRAETSGMSNSPVSTSYHATFEFESGERREFGIGGTEFGLLAEGDQGWLTFQGTRYHGFERQTATHHSPNGQQRPHPGIRTDRA